MLKMSRYAEENRFEADTEQYEVKSVNGFSAYTVLNVNANSNPWLCYALNCDWFRERVVTRWNEVKADLQKVAEDINKEADANKASYLRNFEKWDLILLPSVLLWHLASLLMT